MDVHRPGGEGPPTSPTPPAAAIRGVPAEIQAVFPPVARAAGVLEEPLPRLARGRRPAALGKAGFALSQLGGLVCAALLGLAVGALLAAAPRASAPPATAPPIRASLPSPVRPAAVPPLLAAATVPAVAPGDGQADRRSARLAHARHRPGRTLAPGCCSYAQTIAADRRLRHAYAAAVRSGAPRSVLVAYRDRWEDLRNRAHRRPRRLVSGYAALAERLERIADAARASRGSES